MITVSENVKKEILNAQSMSEFLQVIETHKTEFPGKFSLSEFDDEICAWLETLCKKHSPVNGEYRFQPDPLPNKKKQHSS